LFALRARKKVDSCACPIPVGELVRLQLAYFLENCLEFMHLDLGTCQLGHFEEGQHGEEQRGNTNYIHKCEDESSREGRRVGVYRTELSQISLEPSAAASRNHLSDTNGYITNKKDRLAKEHPSTILAFYLFSFVGSFTRESTLTAATRRARSARTNKGTRVTVISFE